MIILIGTTIGTAAFLVYLTIKERQKKHQKRLEELRLLNDIRTMIVAMGYNKMPPK
jgi:hypothetical protein